MKNFFKLLISVTMYLVLCLTALGIGYGAGKGYFMLKQAYAQLEELHQTQALVIELLSEVSETSDAQDIQLAIAMTDLAKETTSALARLENQVITTQDNLKKKPSYEYLKSVTVPIFQGRFSGANLGWIGTGTVIKITEDYTYILTNQHIAPISNKNNIYVLEENGIDDRFIKAEVIKNSAFRDLSLIRVVGTVENKQVINGLANIVYAEKVYSVGMYLGNKYIYTEGTMAGYQDTNILINAPASYGCSGSGVFDKNGNLVAVMHATNILKFFDTDSAKAVCIDIKYVRMFLKGII